MHGAVRTKLFCVYGPASCRSFAQEFLARSQARPCGRNPSLVVEWDYLRNCAIRPTLVPGRPMRAIAPGAVGRMRRRHAGGRRLRSHGSQNTRSDVYNHATTDLGRHMINRLLQLFGVMLVALGVLWTFQGAGILHLKPILCFADCAALQGPSGQWLVTGLAVIAAGAGLWHFARRRARRV